MPKITQERLMEVLHYDPKTGVFTWKVASSNKFKVGNIAGGRNNQGYLRIQVEKYRYFSHRLAWLFMHGTFPADDIDHINSIRDDNRMVNLREATRSENMQNMRKARANSKSGVLGVCRNKDNEKWCAHIQLNGKTKHLGYFTSIEEAQAAYISAKRELHPFGEL